MVVVIMWLDLPSEIQWRDTPLTAQVKDKFVTSPWQSQMGFSLLEKEGEMLSPSWCTQSINKLLFSFTHYKVAPPPPLSLISLPIQKLESAFFYLATPQNKTVVTSQCVQLRFGDWRGVKREWVSALPVSKREGWRRGKNCIGPRMKNGHANHILASC